MNTGFPFGISWYIVLKRDGAAKSLLYNHLRNLNMALKAKNLQSEEEEEKKETLIIYVYLYRATLYKRRWPPQSTTRYYYLSRIWPGDA